MQSCGCLQKERTSQSTSKNIIGQKYGRLTVIERSQQKNKPGNVIWICKCDCGKYVNASTHSLISGNTKSCGCYKSDMTKQRCFIDLTGRKFHMLTAVSRVENHINKNGHPVTMWLCKCDCGNYKTVSYNNLTSGQVMSCGCVKSYLGKNTSRVLREKNIPYAQEITFEDMKSKNGHKLRIDFSINASNGHTLCLIECQGEQHYKDVGVFGKLQREETDLIKREYCKEHNIPLYEIRYDEDIEDRIDEILADVHYFDEQPL